MDGLFENSGDLDFPRKIVVDIAIHASKCEYVLEVGCRLGLGPLVIAAMNPTKVVTGIDIVQEFIDIANIRGKRLNNLTYLCHDMHTPLEGEYDYIFSSGTFEHFHDPETAINNIFNCLAPEGRFLFEIDLDPSGKNVSHYTSNTTPEFWLRIIEKYVENGLQYITIGNTLTVRGEKR